MNQNIYKSNFLKYPKNFNFRKKFSSKEDGTCYIPWRNKNPNSNISNYAIHKSSIEPYNTVKNKIVSYVIKGINTWLIVGATFIKVCNYRKNFILVGIVPNFRYCTKSDTSLEKYNQIFLGKNIFKQMVDLEKFDLHRYHLYENKLTQLFNNAIKARELKIQRWEQLKQNIFKNNKVAEEQNLMFQDLEMDTNDSIFINQENKSPPEKTTIEWKELQEKLKKI